MANYTLRINGVVRQFILKTAHNKRSFLKASIPAGGGFMLGFNWQPSRWQGGTELPANHYDINASLRIDRAGMVTVKLPAIGIGQVETTAVPTILAEELDIDLGHIIIEKEAVQRLTGMHGQAIDSQPVNWKSVRLAGATARRMLIQAAANRWRTPVGELSTKSGRVFHRKTGRSVGYGDVAEYAARLQIPDEVEVKDPATK